MARITLEIIPENNPVVYIFDIKFDCKARLIDLTPEEDIKDFGHYQTGMPMMDDANMTQLVPCSLSISEIATHMDKGFHIRFVHSQDVLKMYEFTQNFLLQWVNQLNAMSLNHATAPVNELIKLDRFCSTIYEQAKYYDEPKLNSLDQRFGTSMSFDSIRGMFGSGKKDEQARLDNIGTKHRKGFSELLLEHQMRSDPSIGNNLGLDIFARGLNDRK